LLKSATTISWRVTRRADRVTIQAKTPERKPRGFSFLKG
jgi:hypothetical protein